MKTRRKWSMQQKKHFKRFMAYHAIFCITIYIIVMFYGCSGNSQSEKENLKLYGQGLTDGVQISLECMVEPMIDYCNSHRSEDRLIKTIRNCVLAETTIKLTQNR